MKTLYQWLIDNGHGGKLPTSFGQGYTPEEKATDKQNALWIAALKQIPMERIDNDKR